jgi:undecaprenyl-diphosphatase
MFAGGERLVDLLVFRWINGFAGRSPFLDALMIGLAEWLAYGAPLLLLVLWFWPGPTRRERRITAVLTVGGMLLALGVADLPSVVYFRPRPFRSHDVTLLVREPLLPSFPSTHMAAMTALAVGLSEHLGRWQYVAWGVTAGSMLARVYVGAHYPTDVLGGFVDGLLVGLVIMGNRDALRTFALRVVGFAEELL